MLKNEGAKSDLVFIQTKESGMFSMKTKNKMFMSLILIHVL